MVYLLFFYCDYFYQTTTTTRYSVRGAFTSSGSLSGSFCVHLSALYTHGAVNIGACISFKDSIIVIILFKIVVQDILFAVVSLTMVTIAVCSMLLLTLLLLILVGTLVPLYHLNQYIAFYCDYFYQSTTTHYPVRGGNSSIGDVCGLFYINISQAANFITYGRGACLSFK